jgi:hypothetical protein
MRDRTVARLVAELEKERGRLAQQKNLVAIEKDRCFGTERSRCALLICLNQRLDEQPQDIADPALRNDLKTPKWHASPYIRYGAYHKPGRDLVQEIRRSHRCFTTCAKP